MVTANSGIPLDEFSGSKATKELHDSIKDLNVKATMQTEEMIRLTKRICKLTGAMIFAVVIQILIAISSLLTKGSN